MKRRKLSSDWVDTPTAAQQLGISTKHLLRLRSQGLLKIDKHWRDIRLPQASRATYRWHVERCGAVFGIPAEKRDCK